MQRKYVTTPVTRSLIHQSFHPEYELVEQLDNQTARYQGIFTYYPNGDHRSSHVKKIRLQVHSGFYDELCSASAEMLSTNGWHIIWSQQETYVGRKIVFLPEWGGDYKHERQTFFQHDVMNLLERVLQILDGQLL